MSAIARALEAPQEWAEDQHAPPAEVRRWGAPLWPEEELQAMSHRVEPNVLPLDVWIYVAMHSAALSR